MKKLLLNLILINLSFPAFSQIDESKLTLKKEQLEALPAAIIAGRDKECCSCNNNKFDDGGFQKLKVGASSNIDATSGPWTKGAGTPQWSATAGACDNGYISMWGNQVVGESVKQISHLQPGKQYKGKFMARFTGGTKISTLVKLEISVGSTVVYTTSPPITSTNWQCYTIPPFTAPAASAGAYITLKPTNQYNQNSPDYISWIQVDSICLEEACNCDQLAKEFKIEGASEFCKPKVCDTLLTYKAPKLDTNCYKYTWQVSPEVPFDGQGTNQINIPCKAVKSGEYKIALQISCADKKVASVLAVKVCEKPDPTFAMSTNGTGLSLTSTSAATHYWFLIEDNDSNCSYSNGDVLVNPTALLTNNASFNSLVNNKQYMVFHFVTSDCSTKEACWSLQIGCFKFLPALKKSAPGTPAGEAVASIQKISDQSETAIRGYPIPRPPYHNFPLKLEAKASDRGAPIKGLNVPLEK